MKLSLGYSPCPNDCYIFDALVNGKIDTHGIDLDVELLDIETLNKKAFDGNIDIVKLSYHALLYLTDEYEILDSGSALGEGCGPLLITNSLLRLQEWHEGMPIAIPGKYTTANFLLSFAYPKANNKIEMPFHEIEEAVATNKVSAGVIIHENRFTYESKGLYKIKDLGEFWEEQTQLPIPLGGIAIKRSLDSKVKLLVNDLLKKSVRYAFNDPASSMAYVRANAQEMDESVMKAHIALYVNEYSLELGTKGRNAIKHFFNIGKQQGIMVKENKSIFLTKN